MKALHFTYEMQTEFADRIRNHHYTLKCVPETSARQRIEACAVRIDPEGQSCEARDSFGNHLIYGSIPEPHGSFSVTVTGRAVTGLSDREPIREPERLGSYLVQTACTRPGEQLKRYFIVTKAVNPAERPLDAALSVMEGMNRDYRYRPGVTQVGTSAEEAWAAGGGVCQDWCHIMLCLCRMARIPCRYVVGMLIGEGYSHAWVEVAQDGYWYALDPTNHKLVTDEHIRISCGRDYHDCVVNRGIFQGPPEQKQKVRVVVEE